MGMGRLNGRSLDAEAGLPYRPEDKDTDRKRDLAIGKVGDRRSHGSMVRDMKRKISQSNGSRVNIREMLGKLTAEEGIIVVFCGSDLDHDLFGIGSNGLAMVRPFQLSENYGETDDLGMVELKEENRRLKQLTKQLAQRIKMLEKRLTGLGWMSE